MNLKWSFIFGCIMLIFQKVPMFYQIQNFNYHCWHKFFQCKFYVRHENATASLGRVNIIVRSGHRFFMDASKSVNNDLEMKNIKLEFKWNCTSTTTFCDNLVSPNGKLISFLSEKCGVNWKYWYFEDSI